jgi:hypothetical protein
MILGRMESIVQEQEDRYDKSSEWISTKNSSLSGSGGLHEASYVYL